VELDRDAVALCDVKMSAAPSGTMIALMEPVVLMVVGAKTGADVRRIPKSGDTRPERGATGAGGVAAASGAMDALAGSGAMDALAESGAMDALAESGATGAAGATDARYVVGADGATGAGG
jgi:hypothetical protein